MTQEQWEALCDGCGRCCLHKLENADTGAIYYTPWACRYLDIATCKCTDYAHRFDNVPECVDLKSDLAAYIPHLPSTCAYKRLYQGQALPQWHPLVSGNRYGVHDAGISVRFFARSETEKPQDRPWEDDIVDME